MTSPFGDLNATNSPPDDDKSSNRKPADGPSDRTGDQDGYAGLAKRGSIPPSQVARKYRKIFEELNAPPAAPRLIGPNVRTNLHPRALDRSPLFSLGRYRPPQAVDKEYEDGEDERRLHLADCEGNMQYVEERIALDKAAHFASRQKRRRAKTGDVSQDRLAIGHALDVPGRRAEILIDAIEGIMRLPEYMPLRKLGRTRSIPVQVKTLQNFKTKTAYIGDFAHSGRNSTFYVPPRDMANLKRWSEAEPMTFRQAQRQEYPWWDNSVTLFFSTPIHVPDGTSASALNVAQQSDYDKALTVGLEPVPIAQSPHDAQVQLRRLGFDEAFFGRSRLRLDAHVEAVTFLFEGGKSEPRVWSWVALSDPRNPKARPLHGSIPTDPTGTPFESLYVRALSCFALDREMATARSEAGRASLEERPANESPTPRSNEEHDGPHVKVVRFSKRTGRGHVVGGVTGREVSGHYRNPTTGIRYKRLAPGGPLVPVTVPIRGGDVKGGPPKGQVIVHHGLRKHPEDVVVPDDVDETTIAESAEEIAEGPAEPAVVNDNREAGPRAHAPAPRRRLVLETETSAPPSRSINTDSPSLIGTRSAETTTHSRDTASAYGTHGHGREHHAPDQPSDTGHDGPAF